MGKFDKLLDRILRGASDSSIRFKDLCSLLRHLGFQERIKGSHHIWTREGVDEILNIQPIGSLAKPYQVRQIRNVILRYRLAGGASDEES
jgi:hypothetical protein